MCEMRQLDLHIRPINIEAVLAGLGSDRTSDAAYPLHSDDPVGLLPSSVEASEAVPRALRGFHKTYASHILAHVCLSPGSLYTVKTSSRHDAAFRLTGTL